MTTPAPPPVEGSPTAVGQGPAAEAILEDAPDLTIVKDPGGVITYASAASKRLFGWEPGRLVGSAEEAFIHGDDRAGEKAEQDALREAGHVTSTFRFLCRDGSYCWVEATTRRTTDGHEVKVLRDVSERRSREEALTFQASTDPLTRVANRRVLLDRLQHALRRLDREGGVLGVLYLDLDQFKVLNDSFGHRLGDEVLMTVAERLARHVRPSDTIARMGGDEFVVVVEDLSSQQEVEELAARVVESGREPFRFNGESFVCTFSVGIAATEDPTCTPEDLLRQADLAMYKAKTHGRDRADTFDEELRARTMSRKATEQMIRSALEEDRIRVAFQPIIDIASRAVAGAEALVRITEPGGGDIPAAAFVEQAEETGLMVGIDDIALDEAARQASAWRSRLGDARFSSISVNVTARHLADPEFAPSVVTKLDAYGLPHGFLQIEITERVLMEATGVALSTLHRLRAAGIRVGLDDFGSGYSSIAYLLRFPLDFVKIDQRFIHYLEGKRTDRAIVAAIITLAHALGLSVVAEGVETEAQLEALSALHCDRAQGFLFGAASGPNEVEKLVSGGA